MIKANELRIGNLVTWEDEPDRILKVDEIGYNRQKNRWVRFENGDGSIMDDESFQVIGIPLTEEWLLRFGFIQDKKMYLIKGMYIWKCNDMFICDKNGVIIQHVHQLQNLYFALTGEELNERSQ